MSEEKLVAKGPIFKTFKQITDGINISNEIKDQMIDYLEEELLKEIKSICSLSKDLMDVQGKRTIQQKDWEFILKILKK